MDWGAMQTRVRNYPFAANANPNPGGWPGLWLLRSYDAVVVRSFAAATSRVFGRLLGLVITMGTAVVAITACLAVMGSGFGSLGAAVEVQAPQRPAFRELKERSVVFDSAGIQIAVFRSEENRRAVPLDRVPKHLVNAILDVEDAGFYRHKGVNLKSTGRAMLQNLNSGEVEQGGSTITQQLVKIDLLTRAQKLDRKVREARYALQLEKELSKDEILERYLNSVYFGGGAYGVEAAANHYFAVSVSQLSVPQSAFIAGMIRNPTGYDPVRFRDRSRQRRSIVLGRMVAVGHLSEAEASRYRAAPMPVPVDDNTVGEQPSSYFVEQVKQELLDDSRLGDTEGERYQSVFNGGLRIYTTFDPVLQRVAEEVVADAIPEKSRDEFTASLVSVDVASAAVKAMVAGRGFEKDQFNLVTQARRQPGSSWKPFTLIAALEGGNSAESIISGVEPCPIPNPKGEPNPYLPSNYDGSEGFVGSLTDQLVNSSNCAYARLNYVVGTRNVIDVAKRLGITTKLDDVPAIALGAEEVRPIDMVGAYATIARDGEYIAPYFIERVEDSLGNVLWRASTSGKRVISVNVARAATEALREVVRRGTGTRAALGEDRQVAGKTGTAQNYEDAWFVGYTAQIATAVWMGSPTGKTPMRNVGGIAVSGGSYPAEIWHDYMKVAVDALPVVDFEKPSDDAFGAGKCLQVERPKNAKSYSTKTAAQREKERQTSQKSNTGSSATRSTSGSVGRAESVRRSVAAALISPIAAQGRTSRTADKSPTKTVAQPTKTTTKASNSKKRGQKKVVSCESWGGSGAVSSSSSKSSKNASTKTAKSKVPSKSTSRTKITTPADDSPTPGKKKATRTAPATGETNPAEPRPPVPEPVPDPVSVPVPVPVEPQPAPAG